MPTEDVALKTAVSRFLVESGKITSPTMPPSEKMIAHAKQAQAIISSNPTAKHEFLAKYPHFAEACEKAMAFRVPVAKAVPVPETVEE